MSLNRHLRAHLGKLRLQRREHFIDVDGREGLVVIQASEQGERAVHHALHLIELPPELHLRGGVIQHLHLQPQTRQRSLEIM